MANAKGIPTCDGCGIEIHTTRYGEEKCQSCNRGVHELKRLQEKAERQMAKYPQYKNHAQKYTVVGTARKDIKTKMGLAVAKGERVLCGPDVREFTDLSGRGRRMVWVWSFRNQIQTSVDAKDILL